MPRYEYRNLRPLHGVEEGFLSWIDKLDEELDHEQFTGVFEGFRQI